MRYYFRYQLEKELELKLEAAESDEDGESIEDFKREMTPRMRSVNTAIARQD